MTRTITDDHRNHAFDAWRRGVGRDFSMAELAWFTCAIQDGLRRDWTMCEGSD